MRKRGKNFRRGFNIQINFTNRFLYTFVAFIILLIIGVSVFAFGTSTPSTFGHSAGELDLSGGVSGNAIFNDNVGIGTTSPTQKLDVFGNLRVTGAIVAPEGTLRDDGGGWIRTYGNTGWYSQTYGGGWYMTDGTWIRSYNNKPVYVQNNLRTDGELQAGASGSRFVVKTSGNVGIGTSNPTAKLVIRDITDITPDGIGAGQLKVEGNGYTGFIALDLLAMYVGHNSGSRRLDLMTDETTRLSILAGGNVGIGTTNPTAKLHVVGKITATGGVDPPYVSFSSETHDTIREYAKDVEEHETVMIFWNKDTKRMEVYVIEEDKFYVL